MNNFKQEILNNQDFIENIEVKKRDYHFYDDLLSLNKIVSFVWPRRVWKTFLMFQFIKELIKNNKLKIEQVVFIDFSLYSGQNLSYKDLLLSFWEIEPHLEPFFIFDEIQDISNFKEFVLWIYNLWYKIFLSWSNSKLLSSELSTHFRWRVFEYNILPLTFKEVLSFKNISLKSNYSTKDLAKIHIIFEQILRFWSFPEIVLSENELFKIDNLKTYLDVMLYKDLLERYKIKNEVSIKYLLKNLTVWFTKNLNISKIYNNLKSQNIKIGKSTLFDYYEYIKNIFYVYELDNFYNRNASKKIFLYNIWFNALFSHSTNFWQAFENIIFLELIKKYKQVSFKKNLWEIDFFIAESKINIQVCYELNDENFKRETQIFEKTDKTEKNILVYFKNTINFSKKTKNFELLDFMEFIKNKDLWKIK